MNQKTAITMEEAAEELAPQRRFQPYPEYRDSGVEWLGHIPNDWNLKRLKHVSKCLDGKRVPLNAEQRGTMQGDYPYWGANGVLDAVDDWLFDEPLVLLGEDGAPFFEPHKDVAFSVNGKIWVNNHAHVLRPTSIVPGFLAHFLNTVSYSPFIEGTTRDKLVQGKMKEIPVVSPPRTEQLMIAAFLNRETARIDELIAKKQRLIELLAEKRTALISHAVTKGLNPDAPMKDSGIDWLGKVPEHWRIKKLKFLEDGGLQNGLFKKKQFFGSGVRLVNVFDIYREDFLVDETTLERVEADGVESRRYAVQLGDIFFVRSSLKLEGVGKSACMLELSEPAVFECHLVRMRPSLKVILPHFLINSLNSIPTTNRLIALANQVTMTTIDQDKFKSLEVPVPPLREQEAIIELLSEHTRRFFALTSSVSEAIDKLREYRSALISAAVTGKIDVREVASVVPARRANVHFHRCVLAAEIVDRHLDTPRFGRIKLQKLLILTERHLGLDEIQSQPVRASAGPFDNRMMRAIHAQLKRQKWFDPTKTEHGIKYVPMDKHGGHREYFERYWGDRRQRFDALMVLLKPMKTEQAEIVATLYMAWNDFIIAGDKYNDERIVSEVLNNWDSSKQDIEPDRWRKAITWMREKGLVPCGYGSATRKAVTGKIDVRVERT